MKIEIKLIKESKAKDIDKLFWHYVLNQFIFICVGVWVGFVFNKQLIPLVIIISPLLLMVAAIQISRIRIKKFKR